MRKHLINYSTTATTTTTSRGGGFLIGGRTIFNNNTGHNLLSRIIGGGILTTNNNTANYSILSKRKKIEQKINQVKQQIPKDQFKSKINQLFTSEKVDQFIEKQFPNDYKDLKKREELLNIVDEPIEQEEQQTSNELSKIDTNNKKAKNTVQERVSFKDMLTKEEKIELTLENLHKIFKRTAEHSPKNSKVVKVTIVGNPNAGKSTILNRFVSRKVSAVSPKTQTTRSRSLAVLNNEENQIVFFDTPGILNMEYSRLKTDKTARETIEGLQEESCLTLDLADVVLLLIDVTKPLREIDHILDLIANYAKKDKQFHLCALINKSDMVEMDRCEEYRFELVRSGVFNQAFIISAKTGYGMESVIKYLCEKTRDRKWFFDKDQVTPGITTMDTIKEIIREKLYRRCNKEIPYQTVINITKLELSKSGEHLIIDADLIARTNSQLKIIQQSLKYIHTYALADLHRIYKVNIHLNFGLKVKEVK
ncbi:predicted protein [Naegleria gruberi]|uniref:Predicted protein n=1 Tax=Naegleria gruberi TaxID=5762 RepID=D2UX42_NAEGR|nr:uncharacterized protein NAEGRDRAFT_61628 [Naegleria gruberi]EFC50868.1 predicted protein [Naegleria gruberi]|eukprot:XP_002683612.1 predicted protein [Naegleria gruberi strain NEG-M]